MANIYESSYESSDEDFNGEYIDPDHDIYLLFCDDDDFNYFIIEADSTDDIESETLLDSDIESDKDSDIESDNETDNETDDDSDNETDYGSDNEFDHYFDNEPPWL
jgi:hypothetical protein